MWDWALTTKHRIVEIGFEEVIIEVPQRSFVHKWLCPREWEWEWEKERWAKQKVGRIDTNKMGTLHRLWFTMGNHLNISISSDSEDSPFLKRRLFFNYVNITETIVFRRTKSEPSIYLQQMCYSLKLQHWCRILEFICVNPL